MTFYDRYAVIAENYQLDPCSQKAADLFGLTKATISSWNIKGTTPKGETVAIMADKLHVSADYLLGRTDDPQDYAKFPLPKPENNATPTDTKATEQKTVEFKKPQPKPDNNTTILLQLYSRLDESDKLKAVGVLQGMLMQDKYLGSTADAYLNAAHARTDINVTPDMISHDEKIMDDENF